MLRNQVLSQNLATLMRLKFSETGIYRLHDTANADELQRVTTARRVLATLAESLTADDAVALAHVASALLVTPTGQSVLIDAAIRQRAYEESLESIPPSSTAA